ncbi:branched-chain amino acid ABC transporter permease [Nocardioides halotolerans]|uniref:branched-chain amino acid ABC transporter permease n=1 Tax=Nocardioides halotolerans TaxID=433660 RepID=UPI000407838F|nr:branched-chain amino acid ABC transporter permease [Nocardioides halotolerans]
MTVEAPLLLSDDPLAPTPSRRLKLGISPRGVAIGAVVAVVAAVAGLAVPSIVNDLYWMGILVNGLLLAFMSLSVGFMAKHLGLISLGQTAFFGGSAYLVCIATSSWEWSPYQAVAFAILGTTAMALAMGVLVVRATGIGFMMLTLAMGQAIYQVVIQEWARDTTGSFDGVAANIGDQTFLGMGVSDLLDPTVFWNLGWIVLVAVTYLLWVAGRSRFGVILEGTRENTERMRFSGYNTFLPRLAAFVFSGFVAAVGGALYGLNSGYVSPELLNFLKAGDGIIAAIVGGLGVLLGPFVGAFLYVYAQAEFNNSGNLYLYTGIASVLVLVFLPGGIVGTISTLSRRLWSSRTGRKPQA